MNVEFTPDPLLYPFTSRWFDSSRGRVHYIDEGDGPPLLLCHGNPTWSFLYRHIVVALRDRFRCIAPDYLGFGLSERPDGFGYTIAEHASVLGEFVDHLGLDRYLTMGQDWGGPISMAVAVGRAQRVRGVVLGNTWFWPTDVLTTKIFLPRDVHPAAAGRDPATQFLCRAADPAGHRAAAQYGGDGSLPVGAAQPRGANRDRRNAQGASGGRPAAGTAEP